MKAKKFIALMCMLCLVFQVQPADAKTKKVSLNKKNITIKNGKTLKLKLKNCDKKIKWSSDDVNIATVNGKGKVCAKGLGNTVIKAKAGKKTYKCKLTVRSDINSSSITLSYKNNIFTKDICNKITSIRFGSPDPRGCQEVTDTTAIKKIFSMFSSLEFHAADTPKGVFAGEIRYGFTPPVYFILDDNHYIKVYASDSQASIQTGFINTQSLYTGSPETLYEVDSFYDTGYQNEFWNSFYKLFDKNKEIGENYYRLLS